MLIRVILGLESGWGLDGPLRPALGDESGLIEAAVAPGLGEEAKTGDGADSDPCGPGYLKDGIGGSRQPL